MGGVAIAFPKKMVITNRPSTTASCEMEQMQDIWSSLDVLYVFGRHLIQIPIGRWHKIPGSVGVTEERPICGYQRICHSPIEHLFWIQSIDVLRKWFSNLTTCPPRMVRRAWEGAHCMSRCYACIVMIYRKSQHFIDWVEWWLRHSCVKNGGLQRNDLQS